MAERITRTKSRRQSTLKIAKGPRNRGVFAPVAEAVEAIRAGQMVIVVDDEDRENEGDLTVAAEKATPELINFMAKHGRGLICLPMAGDWLDRLEIPLMVSENTSQFSTAFCVSIEAKESTSTGISAADRARPCRSCSKNRGIPCGFTTHFSSPTVPASNSPTTLSRPRRCSNTCTIRDRRSMPSGNNFAREASWA